MNKEKVTINDLPDNILCNILSPINIINRQRLEIVCKRWQQIIQQLWKQNRKLIFEMLPYLYDGDIEGKKIHDGIYFYMKYWSEVEAILKLCRGCLNELRIYDEVSDLGKPDDMFESLIQNKHLKLFSIQSYDGILIKDFLRYLPITSLEELTIFQIDDQFDDELSTIIEGILKKASELISLKLSGVTGPILRIIAELSGLKSLKIGNHNYSLRIEDSFLDTTKLGNLEKLTVHEKRINRRDFLIELGKNCRKLRILDLNVSTEIEILKNYFSNLEEFYCDLRDHDSIDEETLTKFFERSPKLRICHFYHHPYHELVDEVARKAGTRIKCLLHY